MNKIERCMHQVFISEGHKIEGRDIDYCDGCEYDPKNNKKCSFYSPVKVRVIEIKEPEEDSNKL